MHLDIYAASEEDGFAAHGMSTNEDLDPCPFCGGMAIEVSNSHTPCYTGTCLSCGAEGPRHRYDDTEPTNREHYEAQHRAAFAEAVKLWNQRG